jgi:predicted transcriptional regulator of viral defense system
MDKILMGFKKTKRAAFRTKEYSALLGKKTYARLVLHRLKKKNELVLVRNGFWAFPDSLPEAIACEVSMPCYLSFHSAIYMHGLTTQIPRVIQLAVTRNAKSYYVLSNKVQEYKIKKVFFTGFTSKDGLLLASPEKAFADSINVPRSCPDFVLEEVLEKIDLNNAKKFISKPGLKRLGGFYD